MTSFALLRIGRAAVAFLAYISAKATIKKHPVTKPFAMVILGFIALLGFIAVLIIG